MSIEPSSALAQTPGYADGVGVHTHPTPMRLRIALVCFAVGLLVYGALTAWVYTLGQRHDAERAAQIAVQARLIAEQTRRASDDAYDTCEQRHDNAVLTLQADDAILAQSSIVDSDPVVKAFIQSGRDGAARNAAIVCTRQ